MHVSLNDPGQKMEETILLKPVFGSSRYLNRLPRYNDSKQYI